MRHLDAYLAAIRSQPLVQRDEERSLALRYRRTRDPELARKLVSAHLRLVVKIARQYRWAYANLADLIEEGNVGLLRAVTKYDPRRGVRLSSYSSWWIRAMILRFIVDNWRLVRVGTTADQRKVMFRLNRERARLEQLLGAPPDPGQLAERLGVKESTIVALERHLDQAEVRLDAPIASSSGETTSRMATLAAPESARPDRLLEERELRARLRGAIQAFTHELDLRDRQLFRLRWLGDEQATLQEVGDRFGITRERARQLESRILVRLRAYLQRHLGDGAQMPELIAA